MSYQFTAVSVSILERAISDGRTTYQRGTVFARDAEGHFFVWQHGIDTALEASMSPDEVFLTNLDKDTWPINDDGSCTLFRDHWRHFATPSVILDCDAGSLVHQVVTSPRRIITFNPEFV